MIIRVDWIQPNENGYRMYHMYDADHYFVEYLEPSHVRLMIDYDGQNHDILLANGDKAYVMNNEGKTVDVINSKCVECVPRKQVDKPVVT